VIIMDFVSIATGAVSLLTPFLPQLISLGSEVGGKIKDAVVDKGVSELGKQAKTLWSKITGYFGDDPVLTSVATVAAAAPEDTGRQKLLIEELAKRLKDHPDFAQELLQMMGGPKRVQELTAGYEAIITDVSFKMAGPGEQKLKAGDRATIAGIDFDMK
jgi:hypothetical protein